ncbi:Adipose-regulatory protein [Cinnamomum micranthum f. kanehirae]|uniref:Adipose-regulatory protein n=1 Tax=Cinnamomum micranthum f. kanehirae TaxID=337451 RepID=A0A3S3N6G3_9MAGN|nr:Adipose-regulatory protein [Cinnamomum micranthum f. kanehirae]
MAMIVALITSSMPSTSLPPLDPIQASESEESVHLSLISQLDSFEIKLDDANRTNSTAESSRSSTLRRRSFKKFTRPKLPNGNTNDSSFDSSTVVENGEKFSLPKVPNDLPKDSSLDSSSVLENGEISDAVERKSRTQSDLKEEHDKVLERSESLSFASTSDGVLLKTDQNREQTEESGTDGILSNSLITVAELVIKVIGFQISLLISSVTFPFWLMYSAYMLVKSPFQTVNKARDLLHEKFSGTCSVLLAAVSPLMHQQLKGSESIRKFALRISWGCLWSIYVCCALSGVLVSAFIMGGITMRHLVEEPIGMENVLNFDYTKANPDAFVPIVSCHGVDCGLVGCAEKVEVGRRVIPPNRRLEVTVSLLLPESDHNRELGVFQVRVEFLSSNGKVSSALSHPCMLTFKSLPIRYFETFLKSAPLLAGYSSESQLLKLRMTGFVEGTSPTVCLRVILEQRAEFKPGAGIPQIYAASLTLESELPLLKRIIWKWRKTIFVWTCMWFFMMELVFILACCRPFIIPRSNTRNVSGTRTEHVTSKQEN